jgi:hypothetical protein
MKLISCLFLLLFSPLLFSKTKKLSFERIAFNSDDTQLSGLTQKNGFLYTIGDKLTNQAIYKVAFNQTGFDLIPHIRFSKLKGHKSYLASAALLEHAGKIIKSPMDLEGITYCGNDWYLANEQVRHILKVNSKEIVNLGISFEEIFKQNGSPLEKISTNAGFEGLTMDCKNNTLYVAQERQPRALVRVPLTNKKPDYFGDTKVTPHPNEKVSSDYADLYYEKGYLYALERNSYLISKIDTKTMKVIEQYSFQKLDGINLEDVYDTGEPFGIAEGLYMNSQMIYIALDNNAKPISKKASKKYDVKGNFSAILFFKRPWKF